MKYIAISVRDGDNELEVVSSKPLRDMTRPELRKWLLDQLQELLIVGALDDGDE